MQGPLLRPKAPHPTPSPQRPGDSLLTRSATMPAATLGNQDGDGSAAKSESNVATVSNAALVERCEGLHDLALINPEFTATAVDDSAAPTVQAQRLPGQPEQEEGHQAADKTSEVSTTESAATLPMREEANANSLASQPSVSPPSEPGSGGQSSPPNDDSVNDGISSGNFSSTQVIATKSPRLGVPPWGSLQLHRKASKRFSPATTAAASSVATSGEVTPCVTTPTRASSTIFERRSNPLSSGLSSGMNTNLVSASDTKPVSLSGSQVGSIAGSRSGTAPRKHAEGDWPAFTLSSSMGFERSGSGRIKASAFPQRGTLGRKTVSQKQSAELPRAPQDQTEDSKRARRDTGPEAVEQATTMEIAEDSETTAAVTASTSFSSISAAPISKEQEPRSDDASDARTMTQSRGFVASPGVVAALELAKARLDQRRMDREAISTKAAEADP